MFKLLSINSIIQGLFATIRRFPAALLTCLAGTVVGLVMIHAKDPQDWLNIGLTLLFAAPLFVAAVLFIEAKNSPITHRWLIHAGILVFLLAYFLLLPDVADAYFQDYIRHAMWAIGFVLIVTFIPFVFQHGVSVIARFWEYNRGLIFNVILTGIWTGALQAGIAIALASIDFLFGVRIDSDRYNEVWVVLLGLFAPLFFLSRMPADPSHAHDAVSYPKEMRLFAQFVLVPLVTLYFLILYAYTIRIWTTGEWPDGQLSYMILGFSLVGVVTYLALYPLREHVAWVRHAGVALFIAMIPQVGMLFWALRLRIDEYGATENRYFVFVFGWWLLAMAIYFIISRAKDIRVIPVSIFLIAVITSFGPWGAFAVSERSQVARLENILIDNDLLIDGKYVQSGVDVSNEDRAQVSSIVTYLYAHYGLGTIEEWFGEPFAYDMVPDWQEPEYVVSHYFGMEYGMQYVKGGGFETPFYLDRDRTSDEAVELGGYQYLVEVELFTPMTATLGGEKYTFFFDQNSQDLKVRLGTQELGAIPLLDVVTDIELTQQMRSTSQMTITTQVPAFKAKLILNSISGTRRKGETQLDHFNGLLLFSPLP